MVTIIMIITMMTIAAVVALLPGFPFSSVIENVNHEITIINLQNEALNILINKY